MVLLDGTLLYGTKKTKLSFAPFFLSCFSICSVSILHIFYKSILHLRGILRSSRLHLFELGPLINAVDKSFNP